MDWVNNGSPEGQKINGMNKQINQKTNDLSGVKPKSSISQNFQTRKPAVTGVFQQHTTTGVTPASSLNKINTLEKPVPKTIKPTKTPVKSGGPAKVMNPGQYALKTFVKEPISEVGAGLGYAAKGMGYGIKNDTGLAYSSYMKNIGKPFANGVTDGARALKIKEPVNKTVGQKYITKPLTPQQISQNQKSAALKVKQQKILNGLNPNLPKYTPPKAITTQNTANKATVNGTTVTPQGITPTPVNSGTPVQEQ